MNANERKYKKGIFCVGNEHRMHSLNTFQIGHLRKLMSRLSNIYLSETCGAIISQPLSLLLKIPICVHLRSFAFSFSFSFKKY